MIRRIFACSLVAFIGGGSAQAALDGCFRQGLNIWASKKVADLDHKFDSFEESSLKRLLANIRGDGSVFAAKTARYQYEWVRDAAITDGAILDRLEATSDPAERSALIDLMKKRVQNEKLNQREMQEVKFDANHQPYRNWKKPQNDGPALRAKNFIRFANFLLQDGGQEAYVRKELYNSADFATGIKGDLEYTAHHWWESSGDIWEERGGNGDTEHGYHFFTRIVQCRALLDGAKLADRMGEPAETSAKYRAEAESLMRALADHWSAQTGRIVPTLHMNHGQHLDISIILGMVHSNGDPPIWMPRDPRFLSWLDQLELEYKTHPDRYPINKALKGALWFLRYPGDRYDGLSTQGKGGAWPLGSVAVSKASFLQALELAKGKSLTIDAEGRDLKFYQRLLTERSDPDGAALANELAPGKMFEKDSRIYKEIALALFKKGDAYLELVEKTGLNTEQINMETGKDQGVEELTWNYASVIGDLAARRRLLNNSWFKDLVSR